MAEEQSNAVDFRIDRSNLYREESFTDLKVGSIRRLTPVKPDGSEDKTRKKIFVFDMVSLGKQALAVTITFNSKFGISRWTLAFGKKRKVGCAGS